MVNDEELEHLIAKCVDDHANALARQNVASYLDELLEKHGRTIQ